MSEQLASLKYEYPCERCHIPNTITKSGWFCANCTLEMIPKIYPCLDCGTEYSCSSVLRYCTMCAVKRDIKIEGDWTKRL